MQIPSINVERIENGVARASRIPGYDPSYVVVYFGGWVQHPHSLGLIVFRKDDQYFVLYFGDTEEDGVIPERWQNLKQVSCEQAADHAEAMEVYFK